MERLRTGLKESKVITWMNTKIGKQVIGTILFSALGIILPRIFHILAGSSAGAAFLPMHIAVLMAAMTFGVVSGSLVAGTSIIVSYMLTGMPTAERLPFMLVELFIYAVVLGIFNKKFNSYISLIAAIVIGRLLYAGALFLAGNVFGVSLAGISNVWQAVQVGLPGIMIQIICVPFIAKMIKRGIKLDD